MHVADDFIQSYLRCILHILLVCVFPGNQTHDLDIASVMAQQLSYRNKMYRLHTAQVTVESFARPIVRLWLCMPGSVH